MSSKVAKAIRDARRACGITQQQLGMRLGLKGRAVYRWERGDSLPRKRHRQALVTAINAIHQPAAVTLAAALASEGKEKRAEAAPAPVPVPPAPNPKLVIELAVLAVADELDLPPRRVRGSLVRLLERLREGNLTIEAALQRLREWVSEAQ